MALLWPALDNWNQGDNVWPEGDLGRPPRPDSAVLGSVVTAPNGSISMAFRPNLYYASYKDTESHVAAVNWSADGVRFEMDEVLVATVTAAKGIPT